MDEAEMTPAARLLEQFMSDLSEDTYAAAWMMGTEFELWAPLVGDGNPWNISDEDIAALRKGADHCGGWITGDGFVSMAEWIPLYEAHKRECAERRDSREAELRARPDFNRETLESRIREWDAKKARHGALSEAYRRREEAEPKWDYQNCSICHKAFNARRVDDKCDHDALRDLVEAHIVDEHPWARELREDGYFSFGTDEGRDREMLALLNRDEGVGS